MAVVFHQPVLFGDSIHPKSVNQKIDFGVKECCFHISNSSFFTKWCLDGEKGVEYKKSHSSFN